jgi:hypothetical protein
MLEGNNATNNSVKTEINLSKHKRVLLRVCIVLYFHANTQYVNSVSVH